MLKRVAIGIDLGTTYSCVGIFQNGKVEIIANDSGSRITPSCVAFTDQERLIGEAAKAQAGVNPKNTIFEAKRLIGHKFNDATVQNDVKQWPFNVFDDNGAPKIKVQYKDEDKIFTPEEISSMVLTNMKAIAETYVGGEVVDAVITVPAYFTDSQRQATKDAGEVAGLNVLNIINEPTAAAIAYGVDKKVTNQRNVMIYDLGGGTFDVAILSITNSIFDVKAVGGDTHLGGCDFDNRLVKHFLETISRKHKVDLSANQKALGRLRSACESAKRNLSSALKANVDIACLFNNTDFRASISRSRFEDLCSDLFQQTLGHVATTLGESGFGKDEIHEVVLVGGSTRIPKVQKILESFFDGKKLNKTIHPDEAVAYGAAVKAALLSGDHTVDEMQLRDVTPLTLSVENPDGTVTTVIKRNTKIPASATVERTTVHDYQTEAGISIYEGERARAENNNLLGTFNLDNIQRARKGIASVSLTYEIDENGILHASAIDNRTFSANGVTITSHKGRLQRQEIERMVTEAAVYNRDDVTQQGRARARQALEQYCYEQSSAAEEGGIFKSSRESVRRWCMDVLDWIDENDDAEEQEYVQKLQEMKTKCEPILAAAKLRALTLHS